MIKKRMLLLKGIYLSNAFVKLCMRIYIRAKWLKPLANINFDKCGQTEAAQLDSHAMSSTPTQAEQQEGRKNDEIQN